MRISYKFSILAAGLSVMLGGCGANHHSIYRSSAVSGNKASITLIDAKQRAILTAQRPVSKKVVAGNSAIESYRAFCTEPSPDVFSVLSQAVSVAGNFGRDKDESIIAAKAALTAAFSTSETGATIARTQTINMLREMMYRTCERYLSGALGPTEFPIQAARDQRLMVSILAIEQLTGAVTPKPIAIYSNSNAAAGLNSSAAMALLDSARKAQLAADKNLETAQKALEAEDAKEPNDKKCADLPEKKDGEDAKLTKKRDSCAAPLAAVTNAKKGQDAANKFYEAQLASAAKGDLQVSIDSKSGAQLLESINNRPDSQTIAAVAPVVQHIVDQAYEQDEFLLMCLRVLDPGSGSDQKVKDSCLHYTAALIERHAAEERLETKNIHIALQGIKEADDKSFDSFWSKVVSKNNPLIADPTKLDGVLSPIFNRGDVPIAMKMRLASMSGTTSRDAIRQIFGTLSDDLRDALVK